MFNKLLFVFLILSLTLNTGCHSLRKKFIRKKKTKQEAPVYVDFKEYPTTISRDAYIDYYLFVRGWLDELLGALEKGISYKRQRRAITEAIMNLEQIISFLNNQGKDEIYPVYEQMLSVRDRIQRSPNLSQVQRNSLIRTIEQLKRQIEKRFNYSDVEQWMN
ncbi:MAG: hypothetical protein KJ977_04705 [Candidatus Omnitrophica bacterium]|nr:hypothetical protein [Candidatus Omnitrophota bacterium]MBU2250732.1 hypothetical protein [Candidatus Omnitrophota bacterium]MBU2266321.1 hypothetical protein [Candidatus Omnitrophota bacterium]